MKVVESGLSFLPLSMSHYSDLLEHSKIVSLLMFQKCFLRKSLAFLYFNNLAWSEGYSEEELSTLAFSR